MGRIEVTDIAQLSSQFVERRITDTFRYFAVVEAPEGKQSADDDGVRDAVESGPLQTSPRGGLRKGRKLRLCL